MFTKRKPPNSESLAAIFFAFLFSVDYLTESACALSAGVCVESFIAELFIVESALGASWFAFWSVQDANEIAAIATNIKTNFFIFFAFLICKTIIVY